MTRKLLIAQIVLLVGLSGIYLLPKTYGIRQSAIVMALPPKLDDWHCFPTTPHELVLKSLAKDTDYEQADFRRETGSAPASPGAGAVVRGGQGSEARRGAASGRHESKAHRASAASRDREKDVE